VTRAADSLGIRTRLTASVLLLLLVAGLARGADSAATPPPNVVLIVCDDLGYGDLGSYGARQWRTPHLDRLAHEGMRFTRFYTAQPVCSAARAALLTGCYPNRIGIAGALGPNARIGIGAQEVTLAELLRPLGYATAVFGKWHLGHLPPFLPTRHGFDDYFGLPYSNDMWPRHPEAQPGTYPPLPLFDGESVAQTMPDQTQLTRWCTERAVQFIERNRNRPFFLYVPHSMPHVPLHASSRFAGRSRHGLYGDVIMEIDWSVGRILRALRHQRLERRTLVLFTSDNGPWLSYGDHAGSAGGLREGKGTCWEGGVRVPFIARWPGKIPAGRVCRDPAMTIDALPTIAALARAPLPAHRIDGRDIGSLLRGTPTPADHNATYFFYYEDNQLQAVLSGRWKLMLPHTYRTLQGQPAAHGGVPSRYVQRALPKAELYDLETDPGETRDMAATHPDVVRRLETLADTARADLGDTLTGRVGTGVRPAGRVPDETRTQ
jgi:arylsulfatase A-like enzyme